MSSVARGLRHVFTDRVARERHLSKLLSAKIAGAELLRIAQDPRALAKFVDKFPLQVTGTRHPSPVQLFERDQVNLLLEVNDKNKVFKNPEGHQPRVRFNARKLYAMLPPNIQQRYVERCDHLKKLNKILKTAIRKGNPTGVHVYSSRIWNSLPTLKGATYFENLLYKGSMAARKWRRADAATKESCHREAQGKRLVKHHLVNELGELAKKRIQAECQDLVLQRRWW